MRGKEFGRNFAQDFGRTLQKYRQQTAGPSGKCLTQEELADKLQAGKYIGKDVSYWETGARPIDHANRALLLDLVQVLHAANGLHSLDEANNLLTSGGYSPLTEGEQLNLSLKWLEEVDATAVARRYERAFSSAEQTIYSVKRGQIVNAHEFQQVVYSGPIVIPILLLVIATILLIVGGNGFAALYQEPSEPLLMPAALREGIVTAAATATLTDAIILTPTDMLVLIGSSTMAVDTTMRIMTETPTLSPPSLMLTAAPARSLTPAAAATAIATLTPSATTTATPTLSPTPAATETSTPTFTPVPTLSPTPTATATPTPAFTPPPTPTSTPLPLLTPGNLQARATSPYAIQLSWVDYSDDEEGFYIQQGAEPAVRISANTTSYLVSGLNSDQAYCFRAAAFEGERLSDWTGRVCESALLTYFDDFGDTSGWPIHNDPLYTSGYQNGEYEITIFGSKEFNKEAWERKLMVDRAYTVSADMRLIGPGPGRYGFIFDVQDALNFYLFTVNVTNQNWKLEIVKDGERTQLSLGFSSVILMNNAVNHLRIRVDDSLIQAYVNDELLLTWVGGEFPRISLGVGLAAKAGAGDITVRFDNFFLEELPAD